MGTRAAFWIGDPRDTANRNWLGCKAWDGYPENPAMAPILPAEPTRGQWGRDEDEDGEED